VRQAVEGYPVVVVVRQPAGSLADQRQEQESTEDDADPVVPEYATP